MSKAEKLFQRSIEVKLAFLADGGAAIVETMADKVLDALRAGKRVYLCGNGGSAADCQHIAGELVGRLMKERGPLPCVALTTDTSVLTCLANDYGFDRVFERQVEALVGPADCLLAISTSGNSPNVVRAAELAKTRGARTLGLTGPGGGKLAAAVDVCLCVPGRPTPRVQEAHLTVAHILCDLVEAACANAKM